VCSELVPGPLEIEDEFLSEASSPLGIHLRLYIVLRLVPDGRNIFNSTQLNFEALNPELILAKKF